MGAFSKPGKRGLVNVMRSLLFSFMSLFILAIFWMKSYRKPPWHPDDLWLSMTDSRADYCPGNISDPRGFNFVQSIFTDTYEKFKYETGCKNITTFGGRDDGRKFLCLDNITPNRCLVYSIGSRKDFQFEIEVVQRLGCAVHTFDCTVGAVTEAEVPRGVKFHPWCIGSSNAMKSFSSDILVNRHGLIGQYYTMKTVMKILGHSSVSVLKMDIERHEYSVIQGLNCPGCFGQIALEVHLHNAYNMWGRPVSRTEWEELWTSLVFRDGFRPFHIDLNPLCPCCCEYSFISTRGAM